MGIFSQPTWAFARPRRGIGLWLWIKTCWFWSDFELVVKSELVSSLVSQCATSPASRALIGQLSSRLRLRHLLSAHSLASAALRAPTEQTPKKVWSFPESRKWCRGSFWGTWCSQRGLQEKRKILKTLLEKLNRKTAGLNVLNMSVVCETDSDIVSVMWYTFQTIIFLYFVCHEINFRHIFFKKKLICLITTKHMTTKLKYSSTHNPYWQGMIDQFFVLHFWIDRFETLSFFIDIV